LPIEVSPDRAWCRAAADGSLTLQLHAQPGAKRTGIAGMHGSGANQRLKIRLAAPAVDGKANAALRAFLAEAFGVALRNVELVRGETGRSKTVRITAPSQRPDRDWR
jgi:uncharacterized protein (TIGR00251 family)